MPKRSQFEWELSETLIEAVAPDEARLADVIKQAAVLDWVRTQRLSVRRAAELIGMPYRDLFGLMAAHCIPSINYDEGWLERELDLLERGSASV